MDLLKRELAPILPAAWDLVDHEAARVLRLHLAGRKLVDFCGPFGWERAAVNTGRLRLLEQDPAYKIAAGIRLVRPLVELRAPFRLELAELDAVGRGAVDPDLDEVVRAAERVARFEDGALFNGLAAAGIEGILEAAPHEPVSVPAPEAWPRAVVAAKEVLRGAGVGGPYGLALGSKAYDEVAAASEDGYPLLKHIERQIIDGPIVWAPALEGAALLSTRGGDFELTVGGDLAIGYERHDKDVVDLFLTESFTFRVLERAAAVALRRG
ncbi:family 1 encapsulin nanocompartment shell protein [Sorangium sp. So ce1036]|uniref:family 1 encapsulin nanocompartment shell protein n=1 Tax=Sorangium sp. So ce1036 TaxID=3133328 RepID=UPI003EFCE44C